MGPGDKWDKVWGWPLTSYNIEFRKAWSYTFAYPLCSYDVHVDNRNYIYREACFI
jgi:hypothetical protein